MEEIQFYEKKKSGRNHKGNFLHIGELFKVHKRNVVLKTLKNLFCFLNSKFWD